MPVWAASVVLGAFLGLPPFLVLVRLGLGAGNGWVRLPLVGGAMHGGGLDRVDAAFEVLQSGAVFDRVSHGLSDRYSGLLYGLGHGLGHVGNGLNTGVDSCTCVDCHSGIVRVPCAL